MDRRDQTPDPEPAEGTVTADGTVPAYGSVPAEGTVPAGRTAAAASPLAPDLTAPTPPPTDAACGPEAARPGAGLCVTLARPWLVLDLGAPHRVLSWSLTRPGSVRATRIVWREIRNAELPEHLDARAWFAADLARAGHAQAVALLTSCDIARHVRADREADGISATAVATVGLSNAERVGTRLGPAAAAGTINLAVRLSVPLAGGAALEALSILAEARTAAVMEHGPMLPTGRATGTGTDCIALAWPETGAALQHAGLHTAAGEALGSAAHAAVAAGVRDWMTAMGRPG